MREEPFYCVEDVATAINETTRILFASIPGVDSELGLPSFEQDSLPAVRFSMLHAAFAFSELQLSEYNKFKPPSHEVQEIVLRCIEFGSFVTFETTQSLIDPTFIEAMAQKITAGHIDEELLASLAEYIENPPFLSSQSTS